VSCSEIGLQTPVLPLSFHLSPAQLFTWSVCEKISARKSSHTPR
jgi:hypothetical protein